MNAKLKFGAVAAAVCAVLIGMSATDSDSVTSSIVAQKRDATAKPFASVDRATPAAESKAGDRHLVAGNPWDDNDQSPPQQTAPAGSAVPSMQFAGYSEAARRSAPHASVSALAVSRMSPRLAMFAQPDSDRMVEIIARHDAKPDMQDEQRIEALGGQVLRTYENFPLMAARVPANKLAGLAESGGVSFLDLNARVYAASTSGRQAANAPNSGSGTSYPVSSTLGVAVIDSGVAVHGDLNVVSRQAFNDARSSFSGDLFDPFSDTSYRGSAGSDNWSGSPWHEIGDDGKSDAGNIRLSTANCPHTSNQCLRFNAAAPVGSAIERRINVMGAREGWFYFDWRLSTVTGTAEMVFEASADGGSTWSAPLARINVAGSGSYLYGVSINVSPYLSSRTVVRLRITDADPTAVFGIDNAGLWFRTSTYLRDEFRSAAYNLNVGTENWANNWTEVGDGTVSATAGTIRIESNANCPDSTSMCLRMDAAGGANDAVTRGANINGVFAAALSFNYKVVGSATSGEFVLEASSNGGSSWTVLQRFRGGQAGNNIRHDVTRFASSNTQFRFRVATSANAVTLRVDNVELNIERGNTNDQLGHGTHIAGIVGGNGGSTGSYVGIARGARIHQIRVLDSRGRGTVADLIAGLDWVRTNAAANNIKVVNMSLGTGVAESNATDPLVLAAERVWDAGIVVVASAGNYGEFGNMTITSPGNSRKIITVGSLTDAGTGTNYSDDSVSTFSSRGPTLMDHVLKPDLVAPGNRIVAAINSDSRMVSSYPQRVPNCGTGCTGNYMDLSGTSMSAAMVSGTALLMLTRDPTLTPATIKARLMRSARKVSLGDPTEVGAGVLDVVAALNQTGTLTGQALSPLMERSAEGSAIMVQDTAGLWGNAAFGAGYLWNNGYLWSNNYTQANGYLWADGYLWQNGYLWSNGYLWADGYLWQNGYLWADGYLWENAIAADDNISSNAFTLGASAD
jgi:hypothetical protein